MEIIYLYCAFSYLFMITYCANANDPLLIRFLCLLIAPAALPLAIGALCGNKSRV